MPSAARYSRVPSVAKSSTPRSRRSRASAAIPSRFATDSRARTRGFLPFPWPCGASAGWAMGVPGRSRRRRTMRPSIPPDMAYSGTASTRERTRSARDARPLGVPVPVVQQPTTSRTCSIRPGSPSAVLLVILAILYNVRTRALHRHPPYLEMWEWLWWTGLITFSLLIIESLFVFDFFLVLVTEVIGLGDAGLDPLPALPADPRAPTRRGSRGSATSRKQKFADPEATIRKRARRPTAQRQRRRRR